MKASIPTIKKYVIGTKNNNRIRKTHDKIGSFEVLKKVPFAVVKLIYQIQYSRDTTFQINVNHFFFFLEMSTNRPI